jgi:hypothetical protein
MGHFSQLGWQGCPFLTPLLGFPIVKPLPVGGAVVSLIPLLSKFGHLLL